MNISTDSSFDIFGRQKLESSCTLPYSSQWLECLASLPFSSLCFLLYSRSQPSYPLSSKLVFWSLFGVEITHSIGHLLLFQGVEELIIFFYFWFNLFFMYIVFASPITAGSWWRYIYRTKEVFMLAYVCGASLLIYVWSRYGYLASTALQSGIQLMVALTTSLSTTSARDAMYKWTSIYLFGIVLLISEIVGCSHLVDLFGRFPYHACVDLVMGISCYFHCTFVCELLKGSVKKKSV